MCSAAEVLVTRRHVVVPRRRSGPISLQHLWVSMIIRKQNCVPRGQFCSTGACWGFHGAAPGPISLQNQWFSTIFRKQNCVPRGHFLFHGAIYWFHGAAPGPISLHNQWFSTIFRKQSCVPRGAFVPRRHLLVPRRRPRATFLTKPMVFNVLP